MPHNAKRSAVVKLYHRKTKAVAESFYDGSYFEMAEKVVRDRGCERQVVVFQYKGRLYLIPVENSIFEIDGQIYAMQCKQEKYASGLEKVAKTIFPVFPSVNGELSAISDDHVFLACRNATLNEAEVSMEAFCAQLLGREFKFIEYGRRVIKDQCGKLVEGPKQALITEHLGKMDLMDWHLRADHERKQRGWPFYFRLCAALRVVQQVALLHKNGIVLGDISPENVMLKGGQANIIDFSSAQRLQAGETCCEFESGFKLNFLSPEAAEFLNERLSNARRGREPGRIFASLSQASDRYALGVVVGIMLPELFDVVGVPGAQNFRLILKHDASVMRDWSPLLLTLMTKILALNSANIPFRTSLHVLAGAFNDILHRVGMHSGKRKSLSFSMMQQLLKLGSDGKVIASAKSSRESASQVRRLLDLNDTLLTKTAVWLSVLRSAPRVIKHPELPSWEVNRGIGAGAGFFSSHSASAALEGVHSTGAISRASSLGSDVDMCDDQVSVVSQSSTDMSLCDSSDESGSDALARAVAGMQ